MKIPNTSRLAKTTLLSILSLAGLIFLAPTVFQSASADGGSSTTPAFSNYELAGNPFTTGASVGTTCPNTLRTCMNTEGEPSIRAAPDGSFYGSSERVLRHWWTVRWNLRLQVNRQRPTLHHSSFAEQCFLGKNWILPCGRRY